MTHKYLTVQAGGAILWLKHEISKDYFVGANQRGDVIINLEDSTYFDKDSNSWKPLEGDDE